MLACKHGLLLNRKISKTKKKEDTCMEVLVILVFPCNSAPRCSTLFTAFPGSKHEEKKAALLFLSLFT